MGFNKRIITKTTLTLAFDRDGLPGIEKMFRADALIISRTNDEQKIISQLIESVSLLDTSTSRKLIAELIDK